VNPIRLFVLQPFWSANDATEARRAERSLTGGGLSIVFDLVTEKVAALIDHFDRLAIKVLSRIP
jgi:hypothetical protein